MLMRMRQHDPKDASSFPQAPVEDDQDDDGVTDDADNCPVNPNSLQADLDGDGTGMLAIWTSTVTVSPMLMRVRQARIRKMQARFQKHQ